MVKCAVVLKTWFVQILDLKFKIFVRLFSQNNNVFFQTYGYQMVDQ